MVSAERAAFDARREVLGPAVLLMVVGGLAMLLSLLAFATSGNELELERQLHPEKIYASGNLVPAWANLFPLFFSGVIVLGGWRMYVLKNHRLAVAVCAMAMIPCFTSCCFVTGLPVGLWGLVTLLRPEVRAAFS